jgi:phenylacetate-CoA ligase
MERYLEPGIMVSFERVTKLNRSKSGKLKQFVSYINQTL